MQSDMKFSYDDNLSSKAVAAEFISGPIDDLTTVFEPRRLQPTGEMPETATYARETKTKDATERTMTMIKS